MGPELVRSSRQTVPVPRVVSLIFHFWCKSFVPDNMKLAELSNNSLQWKKYDILGVKTYSDPSYIFLGGQDLPTPRICASVCPILYHYRLPTFYVYFYGTNSVGVDEANFSKFCHTLPLRSVQNLLELLNVSALKKRGEKRRILSHFPT